MTDVSIRGVAKEMAEHLQFEYETGRQKTPYVRELLERAGEAIFLGKLKGIFTVNDTSMIHTIEVGAKVFFRCGDGGEVTGFSNETTTGGVRTRAKIHVKSGNNHYSHTYRFDGMSHQHPDRDIVAFVNTRPEAD